MYGVGTLPTKDVFEGNIGKAQSPLLLNLPIYDFYIENEDKYLIRNVKKINYDYSKPAEEQSKAARDNGKIDIIRGILTNDKITGTLLSPGNFELFHC